MTERLDPKQRFGLGLLVDLSRLLPVDDPTADVVRLEIEPDERSGLAPDELRNPDSLFGQRDAIVTVQRSLLETTADLATAAAEQSSAARDKHGRVPASENPLVQAGLERTPVVSLVAAAFRLVVQAAAGRRVFRCLAPWPAGKRWAVGFTHDVDVVSLWPLFTGLRLTELLARGNVSGAAGVLRESMKAVRGDPVLAGVRWILALEHELGVRSTWFVMAGVPTAATLLKGDVTYRPESRRARRIIELLRGHDHEVALHGSFATMVDGDLMAAERARLEQVTGQPVTGIRQHFLRMRPGHTNRLMTAAGFSYDATYGFSDRNGFRLGLSDTVPGWDAQYGVAAALEEVPLAWMDRALSKYAKEEDPLAWARDGLDLVHTARAQEGLWVGLWHPNLTAPLGFPGAFAALSDMVRNVMSQGAFAAPLAELVSWRVARRSVCATTVSEDGRLELSADTAHGSPLVLEDGAGRPVLELSWPAKRS